MFKTKEKLQKAHTALVEVCSQYHRGESIPLSELEKASGIVRYCDSWTHAIKKLRNALLREHGIVLWSIERGSYKLLTDEEQAVLPAEKRMRRARRQCKRAINELNGVDDSKLSLIARKARNMRIDWLVSQRRQLTRGLNASNAATRPTESLPLRRKPAVNLEQAHT